MSWLLLFFALEIGSVNNNAWVIPNEALRQTGPAFYTEFNVDIQAFDILFVQSRLRTDVFAIEGLGFDPIFSAYDTTVGLRFDAFEIGYRHLCAHPIQTYVDMLGPLETLYEGALDEVYIRFTYER